MLQEIEVKDAVKRELFSDLKKENPGEVYQVLCDSFPLQRIASKKQHQNSLRVLMIISEYLQKTKMAQNLKKQFLSYSDALGILIQDYEKNNFLLNFKDATIPHVLKYLMEEHQLVQKDLKDELGGQPVVSEILSGKRELNHRQIKKLSKRFNVSPGVFF